MQRHEKMTTHQADEKDRQNRRKRNHHQSHRDMVGIERHPVTKQHQQENRHDEGDGDAARVAHDLQELLAHPAFQPHQAAAAQGRLLRGAHAASFAASAASTRRMKASSMLGSGCWGVRAPALMAAGSSIARMRPAAMMARRSQYSASSMKWVVTSTVTPARASALMRSQNSRRASGSTPEVGSSRNRISGWCISAQAIARRCL